MDDYSLLFILFIFLIIIFSMMASRRRAATQGGLDETPETRTDADRDKMREDIKYTQTSRVADQVEILKELGATSPGYRQYCELVGTTQPTGGVTAPYSKRQVAFYNVRCYRVENIYGRESETLVAEEKSPDPFWFKDASGDTPVYVDLPTFGSNVLLVNSCNHIEGPKSDFSKAFAANSSAHGASTAGAMAAVAHVREIGHEFVRGVCEQAAHTVWRLREGLCPQPQAALACVGSATATYDASAFSGFGSMRRDKHSNIAFDRSYGYGGFGGFGMGGFDGHSSGFGGGFGGPGGSFPAGSAGIPGLGSFLGPGMGGMGGYHHRRDDSADVLVGMGLGALLGSLALSQMQGTQTETGPDSTFCGYRIVEDIVPLNYSIYCIGEIYENGDQIHMASSLSSEHTTSFFATKPEAEVLSSL